MQIIIALCYFLKLILSSITQNSNSLKSGNKSLAVRKVMARIPKQVKLAQFELLVFISNTN